MGGQIDRCGYTVAIGWLRPATVGDVAMLDLLRRVAQRAGRVGEQGGALLKGHQPEQVAGLFPMIVIQPVVVVIRITEKLERRNGWSVRRPLTAAVGRIGKGGARVAVYAHGPVAVEGMDRTAWRIHRDLVMVDAEPVALGVAIGRSRA